MFNFLSHKRSLKSEGKTLVDLLEKLWSLKLFRIILVVIAVVIVLPFILFYIYRPIIRPDISYGITFSNKYASQLGLDWKDAYIKILDDLGVRNFRLVAYWDEIETEKGVYDYSNLDWQVQEAQKRNAKIILSFGRKVPRWPECFEPAWWNDIKEEDVRDYHLFRFIETTTERYKSFDSIEMWQVENEPFFPFGTCQYPIRSNTLDKEVEIVRSIDSRPIVIQDSGEGGYWFPSYQKGDYLAISMYRKIWYDFWGVFFKQFIYFQYPLPHWSYKLKAFVTRVPHEKILVTELQAEPWGPGLNSLLTDKEKSKTMSRNDFLSTITYAQRAGFKKLYFWGAEWWLWEKEKNNNPFYWDTAKALIN